jgi:hypothetical protein
MIYIEDVLFIGCIIFGVIYSASRFYIVIKYKRALNQIFKENGINQIE